MEGHGFPHSTIYRMFFLHFLALGDIRGCEFWRSMLAPPRAPPGRCGQPWEHAKQPSNPYFTHFTPFRGTPPRITGEVWRAMDSRFSHIQPLVDFFSFFLALGHIRGFEFWGNVRPPPAPTGRCGEPWEHTNQLFHHHFAHFPTFRRTPPGSPGRCGGPWISHFLLIQPFVDFFSSFSFPRSHSRM